LVERVGPQVSPCPPGHNSGISSTPPQPCEHYRAMSGKKRLRKDTLRLLAERKGAGVGSWGQGGGGDAERVCTVGEEGRNGRFAVVTTPVPNESGKGAFWPLRTHCVAGRGLCPAGRRAAATRAAVWIQGMQFFVVDRLWRIQPFSQKPPTVAPLLQIGL